MRTLNDENHTFLNDVDDFTLYLNPVDSANVLYETNSTAATKIVRKTDRDAVHDVVMVDDVVVDVHVGWMVLVPPFRTTFHPFSRGTIARSSECWKTYNFPVRRMCPPHLLGVTTFLPAIITTTFPFCRLFFPPFRTIHVRGLSAASSSCIILLLYFYRILPFQLLLPLSTLPFSTFRLLSF